MACVVFLLLLACPVAGKRIVSGETAQTLEANMAKPGAAGANNVQFNEEAQLDADQKGENAAYQFATEKNGTRNHSAVNIKPLNVTSSEVLSVDQRGTSDAYQLDSGGNGTHNHSLLNIASLNATSGAVSLALWTGKLKPRCGLYWSLQGEYQAHVSWINSKAKPEVRKADYTKCTRADDQCSIMFDLKAAAFNLADDQIMQIEIGFTRKSSVGWTGVLDQSAPCALFQFRKPSASTIVAWATDYTTTKPTPRLALQEDISSPIKKQIAVGTTNHPNQPNRLSVVLTVEGSSSAEMPEPEAAAEDEEVAQVVNKHVNKVNLGKAMRKLKALNTMVKSGAEKAKKDAAEKAKVDKAKADAAAAEKMAKKAADGLCKPQIIEDFDSRLDPSIQTKNRKFTSESKLNSYLKILHLVAAKVCKGNCQIEGVASWTGDYCHAAADGTELNNLKAQFTEQYKQFQTSAAKAEREAKEAEEKAKEAEEKAMNRCSDQSAELVGANWLTKGAKHVRNAKKQKKNYCPKWKNGYRIKKVKKCPDPNLCHLDGMPSGRKCGMAVNTETKYVVSFITKGKTNPQMCTAGSAQQLCKGAWYRATVPYEEAVLYGGPEDKWDGKDTWGGKIKTIQLAPEAKRFMCTLQKDSESN